MVSTTRIATHRQRARQVLRQVDDLAALHADRGLDLVARDHRPRIGGEHLHRDAEVRELLLDQARGEFQRLGADLLAVVLSASSSSLSGGSGVSGRSLEQRRLLFLLHALRLLDLQRGGSIAAAGGLPRASSRPRPRSRAPRARARRVLRSRRCSQARARERVARASSSRPT